MGENYPSYARQSSRAGFFRLAFPSRVQARACRVLRNAFSLLFTVLLVLVARTILPDSSFAQTPITMSNWNECMRACETHYHDGNCQDQDGCGPPPSAGGSQGSGSADLTQGLQNLGNAFSGTNCGDDPGMIPPVNGDPAALAQWSTDKAEYGLCKQQAEKNARAAARQAEEQQQAPPPQPQRFCFESAPSPWSNGGVTFSISLTRSASVGYGCNDEEMVEATNQTGVAQRVGIWPAGSGTNCNQPNNTIQLGPWSSANAGYIYIPDTSQTWNCPALNTNVVPLTPPSPPKPVVAPSPVNHNYVELEGVRARKRPRPRKPRKPSKRRLPPNPELDALIAEGSQGGSAGERGQGHAAASKRLVAGLGEGNLATMRAALASGADVDARGKDGSTPLMWAVWKDKTKGARLLLESGADVRAVDDAGRTPLHLAVYRDRYDIAVALIRHGADVNAADKRGATPLMIAAQRGNARIVRLLLAHGAKAGIADADGMTALDMARASKHAEAARLLEAEAGSAAGAAEKDTGSADAEPVPQGEQPRSPGESAPDALASLEAEGIGGGDPSIMNPDLRRAASQAAAVKAAQAVLLQEIGPLPAPGGVTAKDAMSDDARIRSSVEEVVRGAEIVKSEWTEDDGCFVTLRVDKDAVARALNGGVDAASAPDASTAAASEQGGGDVAPSKRMCWAALACDVNEGKSLLSGGASANEADSDGITPLFKAVMAYGPSGFFERRRCLKFARLLLEAGADVNARVNGQTALDNAENGPFAGTQPKLLELLKGYGAKTSSELGATPQGQDATSSRSAKGPASVDDEMKKSFGD